MTSHSPRSATLFLPSAEAARALTGAMEEDADLWLLPVDVQKEDDGRQRITVYFDQAPARGTMTALNRMAQDAGADGAFKVAALPDADWVAMSLEGLKPVRAGRFVVHGAHDRAAVGPSDIGLEIEAGQAFGTGHHGTTIGCLLAIDRITRAMPIRNAADIGTGSGVLAIAIARSRRIPVLATDNDPVATQVATANIRMNQAARFVTTATAEGTAHTAYRSHGPFDLIVANILAGPLAAMAPDIRHIAAPRAHIVLSGLLPSQRRWLIAAYRNAGFRFVRDTVVDGWLTMVMATPTR